MLSLTSNHVTSDFHMNDFIPPDLPKTISMDFWPSVPLKDMCESTILSVPESTGKIVLSLIPYGGTEGQKSSEVILGRRDARVGVHKDFLKSQLLVAVYLVESTLCEISESSPGFLSQYARDISRVNMQTGVL